MAAGSDEELWERIAAIREGSSEMTTPHTGAEAVEEAAPAMRTFNTDLARFSTTGHGTIKGDVAALPVGDRVAVTDDEADTLEAEVVAVSADSAEVRMHWDRILHWA